MHADPDAAVIGGWAASSARSVSLLPSGRMSAAPLCVGFLMPASLIHVALIVRDYDEAIAFYTGPFGFTLIEDRDLPDEGKRWVLVAPPGGGALVLLARAATPAQAARIGDQAAGRVFLFLRTDDFWRDYGAWRARGVTVVREPQSMPYGLVAVFADLYGNRWDLIEYAPGHPLARW
jgi:catechol 2,3-dioxygenase-like lactoylglutathione lyase family enzyme